MQNDGLEGVELAEGALYLGREASHAGAPIGLPAKHLTTHGVIVGMTGSGKTGLGTVLLEELAMQGIPAIAIDPKGDLGNLMLAFPSLDAASFAPWVEPGQDPAAIAARHAKGLAEWGEGGDRIARFTASVERVLYTPGSSLGRPLSLMPPLGAPPPDADPEALNDRALAVASGLLTLVGIDPNPVKSPEHTLLATILLRTWGEGRGLDLVELLRAIQTPPFARLGVMDLEAVIPSKARAALAAQLNNAFASPAMAGFTSGEPLDAGRLLWTPEGRPKLSILTLSHLSDTDRMFFVTSLLGELLAWMRAQSGTNELRAVLYMDEVFGYFPPVASPPSKTLMLTLLKQARAFGLGIVLATQNPVDLDYKGLSNAGTWFLGRLQTERDKLRVLDGLESAASTSGDRVDRAELDRLLSGLAPRTFLVRSVHEERPVLLQSRWALSYLRGPLARDEVRRLARGAASLASERALDGAGGAAGGTTQGEDATIASAASPLASGPLASGALASGRPVLPPEIRERFLVRAELPSPRVYRAGALAAVSVRYADAKAGLDVLRRLLLIAPLLDEGPDWPSAWVFEREPTLEDAPRADASLLPLPEGAARPAMFKRWQRAVIDHVVRDRPLVLASVPALGLVSAPDEREEAFRARVASAVTSGRDAELTKLMAKWQPKIDRARVRVADAERRFAKASADGVSANVASGIEIGASLLGAVFGGRRRSVTTGISRAARSARSAASRSASKDLAKAALDDRKAELAGLEADVDAARRALLESWRPEHVELVSRAIRPLKSGVELDRLELCWVPLG